MRKSLVFACAALTLGVVVLVISTGDARDERPAQPSGQDAWKARHAADVVAELRTRDVSHLAADQRLKRARLLDELLAYGAGGRFAQNEDYPGEAIPHLVDRHGTRCALANLIDRSGHGALLDRLAATDNIAFVPALRQDDALGAWLEEFGLSVEEAAYIQGPGQIDDGPGWNVDLPDIPPAGPTPPPSPALPPESGAPPTTGSGRPGASAPGAGEATWSRWWRLNRSAFVNLRERYHSGVVTTGRLEDAGGRRPTEAQIDETVVPLLRKLSGHRDARIRSTALMSWARMARPRHAAEVIEALRAYLREGDNPYRDLMVLAMGVVRHDEAVADLRAVLLNTKRGRALLGKGSGLTQHIRAYAAVALGQCGKPEAVAPLMKILDDRKKKMVDVKACAVMALGTLARDVGEADRKRITEYLAKAYKRSNWSDPVLAAVPTALANAGDADVFLATFRPIVERFRRPALVRQSSVLGLAILGVAVDDRMLDMLIATARRDPDNNARRYGILAIGELAYALPETPAGEGEDGPRAKLGARIKTYFRSAFSRRSVQKSDLPWLAMSAALFVRGFPEHGGFVTKELLKLATGGGTKERQAAAVTALGLVGSKAAVPALRTLFARSKDKLVRGHVAEALGMLGDETHRATLFERLREDGDPQLRYRAALGLGFSADATMLEPLVDALVTTGSANARTALARVVGEIGDRRALPKLTALSSDEKAGTWNRIRAIAAIGMIAEEADHAWVTAFQRGANFPHATPTLRVVHALY